MREIYFCNSRTLDNVKCSFDAHTETPLNAEDKGFSGRDTPVQLVVRVVDDHGTSSGTEIISYRWKYLLLSKIK